ncbi:MAG: HDIG domain-containing protein [Planctomycetaceae bacterium]
MSFFGARRTRQTRVYRPNPSIRDKVGSALQDYRILTRLLVAIFAIGMMQVAMTSWQSRFPWREGQIAVVGVQSRNDFKVEDVRATDQARLRAEEQVRLVFVQNNAFWTEFESRFRKELTDIANAETLEQLAPEVIAGFRLNLEIPGEVEKGTAPTTRFTQVKRALAESNMAIGDRLAQMEIEFSQLLSGARGRGILDEASLAQIPADGREPDPLRAIEIQDSDGIIVSYNTLSDVLLKYQLLETGTIGRAWVSLPNLQQLRPAVEQWLTANLNGQLNYNDNATRLKRREAVDAVEVQYDLYPAGRTLITAGTPLEALQLQVLNEEYRAHEMAVTFSQRLARVAGMSLIVTMMVVLLGIYLAHSEPTLLEDVGQLLALILICVVAVFLSCLLSRDPWRAEVLPLLAAVIVISIVHNQVLATLLGFCMSLLISLTTVGDLGHFATLMVLCLTVIVPLRRISSRSTLIKIGFVLACAAFVTVWSITLISSHNYSEAWRNEAMLMKALKFAGWSLLCCSVVSNCLPFIESAFGVLTDISLLELTDVSHPLLQELARRAPGTYNHSITVASIGEAAAESIGANGLLLRVGAYFHDIGKSLKPEYFIENIGHGQKNPHDSLAPAMSALIIIGHVKDGAEMAEQHNLPRKLINFIEQHHGTTLVEYFFREAASRADGDHRTDAEESSFRYPGPKPQSKETGVMMLADAVESASRTLSEPTPKRIQSLVHEITLKRVLDGQFDQCGLTMCEIRTVEESLVKSLLAAHHGRIKYPDQKTA